MAHDQVIDLLRIDLLFQKRQPGVAKFGVTRVEQVFAIGHAFAAKGSFDVGCIARGLDGDLSLNARSV